MSNVSPKTLVATAFKYPHNAKNIFFDSLFFKNTPTPFPRLINCFITEACNFKCPMCHVVNSRNKINAHIPFSEFKKIAIESKKYSPSFQLAGGEPLLHPDIISMIKLLNDNNIVKLLVTNGLLLEEKAKDLIDSGLDYLAISLDGPDENTQYKRGNVKQSFDKIIKGIEKIVRLRGKKIFPHVRIATVISKYNIQNFEKIFDIAQKLGVDQWSISHHFYYYDQIKKQQEKLSQATCFGSDVWGEDNGSNKTYFNTSERKLISQKLKGLREKSTHSGTKLRISFPNSTDTDNFYSGKFPSTSSKCTSPFNQVYLRGNGDVEMCHGYILGNIQKNSLKQIWKNQKTKKFQNYIKKHKLIPACFRCCSLNPIFE
jgi:MoaA/NifB/PqqE/SkfB family radical SAM enzyme